MKLISIINAWSDTVELLPFCIDNHLQFADTVLVIASTSSNHGNVDFSLANFINTVNKNPRVIFDVFEPYSKDTPLTNETMKRNFGIEHAVELGGFTHFLMADADEFYLADEMKAEKDRIQHLNLNGLVHPLKVYIKDATLCTD